MGHVYQAIAILSDAPAAAGMVLIVAGIVVMTEFSHSVTH